MTETSFVGRTLAGRYDVLALLGAGGMGAVYRARDRELDELVALKVIRAELGGDPDVVERFRSEVKLARRVTHVNVARTFELGNADGVWFATMELVEGESLTQRLRRARKLSIADAVAIAAALCDGLAAAHAADVVHRDIKPDNVLLAADGRVVVADFGVAAVRAPISLELSGTPAYMAPEQATGAPATPAVDVYAVGVLLYEMVTGRRAFTGDIAKILDDKAAVERLHVGADELPPALADVIGRATARDPRDRVASAAALREQLEPWMAAPLATAPVAPPPRSAPSHDAAAPAALTVSVAAPSGESPLIHLAEAVHEEAALRIGRLSRVRVRPRADTTADVAVTFTAGADLAVSISRAGVELARLHVPLEITRVEHAAQTIADAVGSAIAHAGVDSPATSRDAEALELMYRARHLAGRDLRRVDEAMKMLGLAADRAPNNPRIAALLAGAQVRLAFFVGELDAPRLEHAAAMARAAVAAAPELVTAHTALGHVELNLGDPIAAAAHFRAAIACAPHSAEAHEQLGRMLLEAGYLEPAMARLEEAIAINPGLRSARWEIARAWALDGRWAEHEALVAELVADHFDRPISRARYAWWRRDMTTLHELRAMMRTTEQPHGFLPPINMDFVAFFLDGAAGWPAHRASLGALMRTGPYNRRRRAFDRQLVAEAAAFHGDVATAVEHIALALDDGLFDLHWLDRCPMLDDVRRAPELAPLRARIKQRADGILDALYGDHDVGTSETIVAETRFTSP